jgi:hypothetical protein
VLLFLWGVYECMSEDRTRYILSGDAIAARTRAIEGSQAGAVVGWDDTKQSWWIDCRDCGLSRHYHLALDFLTATARRHNEVHHGR